MRLSYVQVIQQDEGGDREEGRSTMEKDGKDEQLKMNVEFHCQAQDPGLVTLCKL